MKIFKQLFYAFICAALALTALGVQPARAAGLVVNSAVDTIANDGACTLREAIANANADNQSGSTDCAAGSGADAITFAADYTITLGSQLPVITSEITITGNGAANTILQANAAPNVATYRVLQISAAGNLTLDGVTVRKGKAFNGGGIFNDG
ncbi:MAG: CSLREA domain-containing protein, partial [Anaerolineales bacterium]|nr:CSLREA domain-containing protein [Anaerolineales bacterium]